MRIAEISSPSQSQSQSQSQSHSQFQFENFNSILSQIESSIEKTELLSSSDNPLPSSIPDDLRQTLTKLNQLSPFPNSQKLRIWKLSYRLWNSCVDLSNTSPIRQSSIEHANLRHIASDLLFLAGDVTGVPSPAIKTASFYYKTGLIWHNLLNFDLASVCFERASDLVSKMDSSAITDSGARKLVLDLTIARSRTARKVSDRNLAVALLSRAKTLMFGLPEHFKLLANEYLNFGKSELSKNEIHSFREVLKLMNEALELFEKGLRVTKEREEMIEFKTLRSKTLRFISAIHLQTGEFDSVLKCVRILREGERGDNHPSLTVLAMKACLGLGRHTEAEKELKGMVENKGIPERVWVSAVETYFEAVGEAGVETVMGVFLGLLERCHVSAGAAVRVAHRVVGDGNEMSKERAKVVAKLVSDERVLNLFRGEVAAKHRKNMHAVLWNCAADHFRSKYYETSAEIFEKSMLYIPYDIENRNLRAKGFRVLCLCFLGLSLLDRAQEYVNEAEKLEPNIACAFLKFKIHLLKNDNKAAINQIQSMISCLDFSPDFLSLSAHEAVACRAFPVAVASLSNLLDFYSSGSGKSLPTTEVVVLRTLITILTQESSDESETLKVIKRACDRAIELGPGCFFGQEEVGRREQNWFAVTSWNLGTKMGKEKKFELCAEFLMLASYFYSGLSDEPVEENHALICKSLTLAVSAMIASEEQTKVTLTNARVKQAKELLDRAGKIMKSISTEKQLNEDEIHGLEAEYFFIYTISAYEINGRLNDSGSQKLLVKRFASSKVCNPKYLLQIGLYALQGKQFNQEVANFALNECLSALLSSSLPEYENVALVFRKLIAITSMNKGETDDDAVLGMYRKAYRIMVGLKENEYPLEEGKWLATTAWNRAALPMRMGEIDMAKKWMDMGLEIAKHVGGMETYRKCMEDFVNGFQNQNKISLQNDGIEELAPTIRVLDLGN